MADIKDKNIDTAEIRQEAEAGARTSGKQFRSPAVAWISVVLTLLAWTMLMCVNGYVAMAVAAVAVGAGFWGMPGRSNVVRNVAITSIIASTVLIVVLAAFLIVIKIGVDSVL